ncbi:MAG: MFS transporter [Planctomycetia bacterium]|nr:MFS transporter [Planctomycetia bacterium]
MKIPGLRWILCSLLFLATALCFLDRQVLSVVAPDICKEFHMDNTIYGYTTTAFLVSYAIMFLLGGRLIDRLGTRIGLGLSVVFWSLSSAVHGFIHTPFQLGAARFALGIGEGGCFPGAAKAASEWFPKKERALAVGIAIGGASLGGVVAPPLTVWCVNTFGWREAFLLTGVLGLIWSALWFLFYYHPRKSKLVSDQERAYVLEEDQSPFVNTPPASSDTCAITSESDDAQDPFEIYGEPVLSPPPEKSKPGILQLLCRKDVIGLAIARLLFDPVFYFYMFWIPKYLNQERGLSLDAIGQLTWIPFFALGVSNILGGWFSDRLVRIGMSPHKARLGVMFAAAIATMSSGIAAISTTAGFAIAMMSILMFAHGFWITNYVTLIGDRFEGSLVATVMGITGMVGTLGGVFGNTLIGIVSDAYSFYPIWIVSGCLYPLAMAAILITNRTESIKNGN